MLTSDIIFKVQKTAYDVRIYFFMMSIIFKGYFLIKMKNFFK